MVSETPKSLLDQARTAKKERRLEEAAELFRRGLTESLNMRATLFEELAYVERNLRDQESSQEHYRQAGEIYRSLGNPLKNTIRHAADLLREQKRLDEAEVLYVESLEIYRRQKDTPPLDLANAIRGFALLKEDVGDRKEALSLWREARDLYELTGIPAGVSESDRRIGLLIAD
ncbi:MAG: tetratricopeptide repeat protein [Terracidiphilus sp.]